MVVVEGTCCRGDGVVDNFLIREVTCFELRVTSSSIEMCKWDGVAGMF
jgi:hypothetical protein